MHRPRTLIQVLVTSVVFLTLVASASQAQHGHTAPPPATPMSAQSWRIADIRMLNPHTTPVTLSPNGLWIAGLDENDRLCVWDVVSLEPACDEAELVIHPESITWSPDSSAVAYSLDAFRQIVESDIHVFELATGASVNLTNDEEPGEGPHQQYVTSLTIDVMPTWSRIASQSPSLGRRVTKTSPAPP